MAPGAPAATEPPWGGRPRGSLWLLVAVLIVLAGCSCRPREQPPDDESAAARRGEMQLTLTVVDDPALAAAVRRRRGEWTARAGGKLDVVETTTADITASTKVDADAVIYPSRLLGTLVRQEKIIPVRPNVLRDPAYDLEDVFPTVRLHATHWGRRAMAIPLGSPTLVLSYRADLLASLGLPPPATWEAYGHLVERLDKREVRAKAVVPAGARSWYPTVEPLAGPWAAHVLLARAACYAKDRGRYSTLFDMETMQPLIDSPAFVRALKEMRVALARPERHALPCVDPAGARQMVRQGHAVMALTWLTAAVAEPIGPRANSGSHREGAAGKNGALRKDVPPPDDTELPDSTRENRGATNAGRGPTNAAHGATQNGAPLSPDRTAYPIAVAALPGSRMVYHVTAQAWARRPAEDDGRVPVIGIAGRLASVTKTTFNAPSAFELLVWLSGKETSVQICPASPATTLFRHSHVAAPAAWVAPATPRAAAHAYADLVQQTLSCPAWVAAPRIPGADRYVAALADAVRQTMAGDRSAADALHDAARKWQRITERLGIDKQKAAYTNSLGL